MLVLGDGILPLIFRDRLAVTGLLAVLLPGLIVLAKSAKPPARGRSREGSDSPAQQWRTRVVVSGGGGRLTEPSAGARSQRVAGYSP